MVKEAKIGQGIPQPSKPVERPHWPQIGDIVEYTNDFGQERAICIEGNAHLGCQVRLGELITTDDSKNPTKLRSTRVIGFTPQGAKVAYHLLEGVNLEDEVVPAWKAEHGHSKVVLRRESFQGAGEEVSSFRLAQEHPYKRGERPDMGPQISRQELDLIKGLLKRHVLPHAPQISTES